MPHIQHTFSFFFAFALVFSSSNISFAETSYPAADPPMETAPAPPASSDMASGDPADTSTIDAASVDTAPVDAAPVPNDTGFRHMINQLSLHYFGIFYGPSVGNPAAHQPTPEGNLNQDAPVLFKNFLTADYNLSNDVSISGTAYWIWKPVMGQELLMRDPYIRIADKHLISRGQFNLYGDFRIHFPISNYSRDNDMRASFQFFEMATYQPEESRFAIGIYGSERMNFFGDQGYGDDLQLYLGPILTYQLSATVALTAMYEMGMSHFFGDEPWLFNNDGTDLQPGISWDVTPRFNVNPYLTFYTGNKVTPRSTAFGMTFSLQLL